MKRSAYFTFILLFIFCGVQFGQHANNWYFGNTAGLNFNTTTPTALTNGSTNISDNTSSISDKNGNLLFYTNGMTIWNKNHQIMGNGTGLVGSNTGGQCALIVPIPCDTNKYVIFHTTDFANPGYLHYSVVDMSLNSGLGGVVLTQKNISLGSGWTEKLCAYYNAVGNHYWVLAHKWGNNQFVAFNVNSTSIATQSVVSAAGTSHTCGAVSAAHDAMGQLTISPDGTQVLNALTCQDKYELLDMNQQTGVVSNPVTLPGNGGNAWGTAFSPDSKKIFTSSIFGQSVFQYDVTVNTLTTIVASKYTLATLPSTGYNFGYMELGPNNKLYIARPSQTSLAVVNSPNNLGATSAFTLAGQSLGSKVSTHGLSRIAYNIPVAYNPPPLSLSVSPTLICAGETATIAVSGLNSYTWNTTSTNSIIYVSPSVTTNYTVIGNFNTCTNVAVQTISVIPLPNITITPSSFSICVGSTATLVASGANSYTWSNSSTNSFAVVSPTINTSYTVTGANFGCLNSTVAVVSVNPLPTLSIVANNTLICPGDFVVLNASGANTFTWSNSQQSNSISPVLNTTTNYSVIGAVLNCTAGANVNISVHSTPILSFNTFSITCGYLGSATLNINGGIGPFSFSWSPSAQSGSIATGLHPGNYTLTVFDQATGCIYTPTTNFAPLIPLTGTVTSSNSLTCNGINTGSANISLSGGSGKQQYSWFDAVGVQSVTSPTNLAAGVNTITVTDSLTFCMVTHTFLITQPPALTVSISANSPSVCLGDSIQLSAQSLGGISPYNYFWSNSIGGNTQNIKMASSGSFFYSVEIVDANNCTVSDSIAITFVPNPVVSVSSHSICPLNQASLTAIGANTYSWSTGASGSILAVSPLSTTVYSVVGSAMSCTSMGYGIVYLHTAPSLSLISNSPICEGDSLELIGIGGSSYLWNGPMGFVSNSQNNSIFNATSANSGSYSLQVTSALGCTANVSQSLVVNPRPLISVIGATVCQGSSLQLTSNYINGGVYKWSGPTFSSSAQSPVRHNATIQMNGSYSLMLTSPFGCTNSAIAHALVVPSISAIISGDSKFCERQVLQLNGSGGTNYTWYGPSNYYSTQQTLSIAGVTQNASGVYTLEISQGPCHAKAYKTVVVNSIPVPVLTNNSPVCEQNPIVFNTGAINSYTWSGPSGFGSFLKSPIIPSADINHIGVYSLSVTDANSCVGSGTISVSVLPKPKLVASNALFCLGGVLSFSASGANIFRWFGPNNFVSNSSNVLIKKAGSSAAGIYTLVGTGLNSCTTAISISVTSTNFDLPVVKVEGQVNSCLNSTVNIFADGGNSHEWFGPNNYFSASKNLNFIATDFSLGGVFTLTVKSNLNCVVTHTLRININPLPNGILELSENFKCIPFCTTLKFAPDSISKSIRAVNYNVGTDYFNQSRPTYCFDSPGQHTINATITDINNCICQKSIVLTGYAKPNADFILTPLKPIANEDRVHFYELSNSQKATYYSWYIFDNDSAFSVEKNPSYLFERPGNYAVVLKLRTSDGCEDTIIKSVLVHERTNLFIPNAFTPNNDMLNDVFMPKGQDIHEYKLDIFNRWGEHIFTSSEIETGWDGNYKGRFCKNDTYAWKIKYVDSTGKSHYLTGNVSLIR